MDFRKLATDVTVFLAPFLPYLLLAGEAAAKKIGEKFGEAALEKAKSLWSKIHKSTQGDKRLEGIATALAENPDDEDFQTALAKLLAKHFESSPELADELVQAMKDDKAVQTILIEQGSKAKDIYQRLSRVGEQKTTIRESQVGNITQEQ